MGREKSLLDKEVYAPGFRSLRERRGDTLWVLCKVLYRRGLPIPKLSQGICAHIRIQNISAAPFVPLSKSHLFLTLCLQRCPEGNRSHLVHLWDCEQEKVRGRERNSELNLRWEGAMEEDHLRMGSLWDVRSKMLPDPVGRAARTVRRKRWWMNFQFKREG